MSSARRIVANTSVLVQALIQSGIFRILDFVGQNFKNFQKHVKGSVVLPTFYCQVRTLENISYYRFIRGILIPLISRTDTHNLRTKVTYRNE
jgi:hypothetical protein